MTELLKIKLTEKEQSAITEYLSGLKKLYADNLVNVILYGSKARGDSVPGSDIDILVILKNTKRTFLEIEDIIDFSADICLKYDLVISSYPVNQTRTFDNYKTPFISNVLSDGISLL